MNAYCELLAKKRKALGKSQSDAAQALAYSVQAIAKYEKGQAEMSVSQLLPAAKFLEVDPDSLLAGVDAKNNDIADKQAFDAALFAKNLRHARLASGLSYDELANAAGISARSLKNYEAGKSVPSFSAFAAILKKTGYSAAQFLSEEIKAPAVVVEKKKKGWPRLGVVFLVVFLGLATGGAGAGIGYSLYRQNHPDVASNGSSLGQTSATPSSAASGGASSAASGNTSSSVSSGSSSTGSSFPTASSSTNGSSSSVSDNGEVGVAFESDSLKPGSRSYLKVLNYDCTDDKIQPAVLTPDQAGGTVYFSAAGEGFYLTYEGGGGTLMACLYDFKAMTPYTTPVSLSIPATSLPSDLDTAINECNLGASVEQEFATSYESSNVTPAQDAFTTLKNTGVSKGYLVLSGGDYSFTETATEAYKKDLIKAENKAIAASQTLNASQAIVNRYQSDVTYLTNQKY